MSASFATTTPPDYAIDNAFGYFTNSLNFPLLTSLNFLPTTSIVGFSITAQTSLQTLSFPNLTSLPTGATFTIFSNSALTSISAPVLATVAGDINIGTLNTLLTSVSMPLLTTVGGSLFIGTNAALPTISLPSLTTVALAITVNGAVVTSISLPNLTTVGNSFTIGGALLTSVNLSSLQTMTLVNRNLVFNGCTSLPTISLPSLVSINGSITAINATALTSVSFPNYLPGNGRLLTFTGCALTQASVDHILARAVANAAYVTGTINTSGGTSAAPGVQGAIDKATLQARGVTVTTN